MVYILIFSLGDYVTVGFGGLISFQKLDIFGYLYSTRSVSDAESLVFGFFKLFSIRVLLSLKIS